jgi:endonuclease-3 related protein
VLEQEEVIVGAVLTQRTNWRNVEAAVAALRQAGALHLERVVELGRRHPARLASLIRSCGFYRTKARYLNAVAEFFMTGGGVRAAARRPLPVLRDDLLALSGVGPETADSILCYALHKPTFVVDEYTRRWATRRRLPPPHSYGRLQEFFVERLPRRLSLYQDLHALIVIDGQRRR